MAVARLLTALAATALVVGCATSQVPGNYEATLPEGRDAERQVRLRLQENGRASVSTARWGSFSYFAEGTWKRAADRTVVVDLASTPPQRLVLQPSGNMLLPKQWDRAIWGDRGPGILSRVQ